MKDITPFQFGPPVGEPYFCDRDDETKLLVARIGQGINVFVLSPRRYGKSSLLVRVADRVEKAGGRVAFVNLMRCTNEVEIANTIASAIVNKMLSRKGRARHSLEDILKRIRISPTVSLRPDGRVELSFSTAVASDSWMDVVDDAIGILRESASSKPAALILDEFQVVASIGPHGLGGAFKALVDRSGGASLVFSGSHLTVMEKLTSAKGAPLQGMGERLVLDVIALEPMVAYLQQRARVFGKSLSTEDANLIYESANAIPNYVQQLGLSAFEAAGESLIIDAAAIERGANEIVNRQVGDYAERFEHLAPSQQRILMALANEPTKRVYTKAFMDTIGVANANAVKKAIDVLVERELVTSSSGVRYVADPFFKHWLSWPDG